MTSVALFTTYRLEPVFISNFSKLQSAAKSRGYDVILLGDLSHHSADEYIQAYKCDNFFGFSPSSVLDVMGFTSTAYPQLIWRHFAAPLLEFYSKLETKYDFYYTFEDDNESPDWNYYLETLEQFDEDFIPTRLYEHPSNPNRGSGAPVSDIFETFYGMWDDIDTRNQYAALCGNARYSDKCLSGYLNYYKAQTVDRYGEVFAATYAVNAGMTVRTLKSLRYDPNFSVKGWIHRKDNEGRDIWNFPV